MPADAVLSEATGSRVWSRPALALVSVIFLTEAAIAVLFYALAQVYPSHLLGTGDSEGSTPSPLIRGAIYAGYALSAYGLAKLLGQPATGWIVDRAGARRSLATGIAGTLAIVLLMGLVRDLTVFVLASAVYGVAVAVVWPAVLASVGDRYAESSRGRLTAAINGSQIVGSAGGFGLGALVIDRAGDAVAFALVFGLNAVALLPALLVGDVARERRPAGRLGGRATGGIRRVLTSAGGVLTPRLALLAGILLLVALSAAILAPDLRAYSGSVLHLQFSEFALLLAIPAAVALLTLAPAGMISDRAGRTAPMLVSAGLWAISMLALTLVHSTLPALLLASLAAFAYALGLPAWGAMLIDVTTAGRRGIQVGLLGALQAGGMALGPALGGLLVAQQGALAPFRVSAILMLLVLALTAVYRLQSGLHPASSESFGPRVAN